MAMQDSSCKGKVLLTGGSGFIASHVLDCLLEHSYEVVVTARSEEKGRRIVDSIDGSLGKKVSFAVIEDIARDGAFDEVVKAHPFDYVVHTASPYQLRFDDPVKDCLDPAIKGTTGILKSVKAFAPTVKRVVITSSSAAVLNPPNHPKVYDETSWADVTWDQAVSDPAQTYRASKKFSEKAAWDFIAAEQPGFDLATINNTYTFGPIPRSLASLGGLNTSNHRIRDMVQGKMKHAIQPTAPVFTFVDVRDVALAHVRAMAFPEAGGHRFYVVGGYFSNTRIADIIRGSHPELRDQLPPADSADDFPDELWQFDTSKSKKLLGLEYTGLEKSVVDTVDSVLRFGGVDN